ncbi:MAG: hypothetical protein DCC58_19930 [Chloroflexi bacterium]|nr:MAG: hypothetical protein DCC58_19930 [Chloroflexota bacterium]
MDCSTLYPIPYIRPATDEEAAEILGALYVTETDKNGDASFDLPAGCYYAVIGGLGYETTVMGAAPGYLEKWFVPPFCQIDGDIQPLDYYDGEYLIDCVGQGQNGLGSDYLEWTDVSMLVVIYAGACAEAAEADNEAELLETCTLPAVYVGGADDLSTQGELPYLWLALAPGTYTLCWEAYWEYYAYGPEYVDYVGVEWNCEEFTIEGEDVTQLVNYSDDHLLGVLDVYVTFDDDGEIRGLNGILVIVFDQNGNVFDADCTYQGWVHFHDVPEGNYTVTATDSTEAFDCVSGDAFETQDASVVYTVIGDLLKDAFIADQHAVQDGYTALPDVLIHLGLELINP